jgi:hypothetical protein
MKKMFTFLLIISILFAFSGCELLGLAGLLTYNTATQVEEPSMDTIPISQDDPTEESYRVSDTTVPVTTAAPETTAPPQTTAPQIAATDARSLYTGYLTNGGYKELTGETVTTAWSIETQLIDLDQDGTDELLIQLMDQNSLGPRGYPSHTALLAIRNGQVTVVTKAYSGGGSIGGERLRLHQNEMEGRAMLAFERDTHDGQSAYGYYFELYDYANGSLTTRFTSLEAYYYMPVYQESVDEIKAQTDVYSIQDDIFFYWMIDDSYVTEENYNAAMSPYPLYPFPMTAGKLNTPLG